MDDGPLHTGTGTGLKRKQLRNPRWGRPAGRPINPARRNDLINRTSIDLSADKPARSDDAAWELASYQPLRTEEKRVRRRARLTRARIGRAPARSSRRGGPGEEEAAPGGGLGVGGGDRVRWLVRLFPPPATEGRGWKGRSRDGTRNKLSETRIL